MPQLISCSWKAALATRDAQFPGANSVVSGKLLLEDCSTKGAGGASVCRAESRFGTDLPRNLLKYQTTGPTLATGCAIPAGEPNGKASVL